MNRCRVVGHGPARMNNFGGHVVLVINLWVIFNDAPIFFHRVGDVERFGSYHGQFDVR